MENETIPVTVAVPVPTEAISEAVSDAIAETLPDAVAEAIADCDEETEDDFSWLEEQLTQQGEKVDQLQSSLSALEVSQSQTLQLLTQLSERIPLPLESLSEETQVPDTQSTHPETTPEPTEVTITETVVETTVQPEPVADGHPEARTEPAPAKRFRRI